jgi:stage II sporulation protein D
VALGDGYRVVNVGAADTVTVQVVDGRRPPVVMPGPRVIRIAPAASGLDVGGQRLEASAVRVEARRGVLSVGGRDYGGVLEVRRSAEGLLLVGELALEDYIAGTVRAETGDRWPIEALRAMAVVARTYAAFHQWRNAGKPYHLVASSQDQNFAGRAADGSLAWEAARSTAGQVLTWEGRVFPAFYHSDSGGTTEPPQTIFTGEGIPPLTGVRDEFALDSPHYAWVVTIPLATIAERLRQGGHDLGRISRLTVVERSPSSRVAWIAIDHSRGTVTLRGADFRRLIGYETLKSTLFLPVVQDGAVRFEGRGFGHGVGLSQFGAKGMAERGYRYPQILEHYYPGSTLARLP